MYWTAPMTTPKQQGLLAATTDRNQPTGWGTKLTNNPVGVTYEICDFITLLPQSYLAKALYLTNNMGVSL